jgi:hypothetical protein
MKCIPDNRESVVQIAYDAENDTQISRLENLEADANRKSCADMVLTGVTQDTESIMKRVPYTCESLAEVTDVVEKVMQISSGNHEVDTSSSSCADAVLTGKREGKSGT